MSNDLISREALKKAIEEYKYCGFYDKLIDLIDNAPLVDTYTIEDIQEVRENSLILGAKLAQKLEGEWLKNANEIYKCSLCGAFGNPNYFRFCPNCGAKMKGGAK